MNYSIKVSRESKDLLESTAVESLCLFSEELIHLAKKTKVTKPATPSARLPPAKPNNFLIREKEGAQESKPVPAVHSSAPSSSKMTKMTAPLSTRPDSIRRKSLDSSAAIRADTYRVVPPGPLDRPPPFVSYQSYIASLSPFTKSAVQKEDPEGDLVMAL